MLHYTFTSASSHTTSRYHYYSFGEGRVSQLLKFLTVVNQQLSSPFNTQHSVEGLQNMHVLWRDSRQEGYEVGTDMYFAFSN